MELQLDRIARRIKESHRARLAYDPELVAGIAGRCTEVESGARNVDHILTRTLLPDLASEFLARMTGGEPINEVRVSMGDGGRFRYEFS